MGEEAELEITSDPGRIDLDRVHAFLAGESYWAAGISRARLERAIAHSLCFSAFSAGKQVGFARVVSDRATFAHLTDLFVLPDARGQGIATGLVRAALGHPELRGMRRWLLATREAHGLFTQQGFHSVSNPDWFMELVRAEGSLSDPPPRG
jgi:GNAT superfamily N-acetyltransferase